MYSCMIIVEMGIIVDLEIKSGIQEGAYFVGSLEECEKFRATYLNNLDEKVLKYF